MIGLYALVQKEFAKDLIFQIDDEAVTLSIKGVLIARTNKNIHNFSFFELDGQQFVLSIQMKGFTIYIGIESDEEFDEDAYPELIRALIEHLLPSISLLITEADRKYRGKADLLLDDNMNPNMKEFFYELLLKHKQGKNPYEQTEIA
ncbi:hypothetical protein [Thermococcus sp.]